MIGADKSGKRVRGMFDRISPSYDLLNHVLSLNVDRLWRNVAARACPSGGLVLDLCCGTGDLARAVERETGSRVIGADFSFGMLLLAKQKIGIRLVQADALRLPIQANTFDACSIAFGVRNFSDVSAGLAEIRRVLKPGGTLVVLEFAPPDHPIVGRLYRFYLTRVLPMVGNAVSRSRAYRYLADTVQEWHGSEAFVRLLQRLGFRNADTRLLTFGIACVYTAIK